MLIFKEFNMIEKLKKVRFIEWLAVGSFLILTVFASCKKDTSVLYGVNQEDLIPPAAVRNTVCFYSIYQFVSDSFVPFQPD